MSAAAASAQLPAEKRRVRWAPALAGLCGLLALVATVEVVLDGAVEHSPLIPKQPAIAGWLSGIGERLGFRVFLIALLVAVAAYAGLLWLTSKFGESALPKRFAIALVLALHAIVFVGPVLLSTDVFSYIAYARMGVEHGLNPYLHGPAAISHDPIFRYVGHDWRQTPTAYGPLYTLLSYPLRAARRRGGAVGDEGRGAAGEPRHAVARLALRDRARVRAGRGARRSRGQPAVRDLRAGRLPQRPRDDARDDGGGRA